MEWRAKSLKAVSAGRFYHQLMWTGRQLLRKMGLLGNPNRVQMGLEDRLQRSKNEIGLRKEKERLKTTDRNNGW